MQYARAQVRLPHSSSHSVGFSWMPARCGRRGKACSESTKRDAEFASRHRMHTASICHRLELAQIQQAAFGDQAFAETFS